jgi:hypothetical protein
LTKVLVVPDPEDLSCIAELKLVPILENGCAVVALDKLGA